MVTPVSAEVAKQARLDYQTTRDAIVDVVNDEIGRVELAAANELAALSTESVYAASVQRRRHVDGAISASELRDELERVKNETFDQRAVIIERRMAKLAEVERAGRTALDAAKDVYRSVVGHTSEA